MSKTTADPLAFEIKAEMGQGKDKATIIGFVRGPIAHAEITFPSSRLPGLMKMIETIKVFKMPPVAPASSEPKKKG